MQSTGDTARLDRPAMRLGHYFETRPNALNFLRLCLAAQVIVWHAYGLQGFDWLPEWLRRIADGIAVDSFFAVSGFLICRAWCRNPSLGRFMAARARRILPGLWGCLLVTAFVFAPVAAWVGGGSFTPDEQWHYVLGNADARWSVPGIGDTLAGLPVPHTWNGSLWTLGFEAWCYVGVAALGVTRLLRESVLAAAAALFWLLTLGLCVESMRHGTPYADIWGRCGLMFSCGGLLWFHRDRVPLSRGLAAASGVALVAGAVLFPTYRLIAAPALAYLALYAGLTLGRFPRLVLRHDLSYGVYVYGFPVQQLLLAAGVAVGWLGFAALSLAAVLPFAAASWFLVERPALSSSRAPGTRSAARAASATGAVPTTVLAHPLAGRSDMVAPVSARN